MSEEEQKPKTVERVASHVEAKVGQFADSFRSSMDDLTGKKDMQNELESLKEENKKLKEVNVAAKSVAFKLKRANKVLLHLSNENKSLKAELESLRSTNTASEAKLSETIANLEKEVENLKQERETLNGEISKLKEDMTEANKENEVKLSNMVSEHEDVLKEIQTQHESVLNSLKEEHEKEKDHMQTTHMEALSASDVQMKAVLESKDKLTHSLQSILKERVFNVGNNCAAEIISDVRVKRQGDIESLMKMKMKKLLEMKSDYEEEIRDLKETAINAQQDLVEEIGRATVAVINLNAERMAHRDTEEGLEDLKEFQEKYYESIYADMRRDLEETEAELLYVTKERDELRERVDDLEDEVYDMEIDLEHAWELGGRTLLREGEEAFVVAPYTRGSKVGGAHQSSRKLLAYIEELEKELFEAEGRYTTAKIHLTAERNDVALMKEELKDTVMEMESWYSIQYDYLKGKLNSIEERHQDKLDALQAEHDAEIEIRNSRIETLEDEIVMLTIAKDDAIMERENISVELEMSERNAQTLREEMEADLDDPFCLNLSHRRQLARALDLISRLRMELYKVRSDANIFTREGQIFLRESVSKVMDKSIAFSGKLLETERNMYVEKVKKDGEEKLRTVGVLEATIEKLKAALQDQITTVGTLTGENNRLLAEVEENQADIERLEEALGDLAFLAETAHKDKQEAKAQLSERKNHIKDLNKEIGSLNAKVSEYTKQLAANTAEKNELTFLVGILQENIASAELQASKALAEAEAAVAESHLAKQETRQFRVQIDQMQNEATQWGEVEKKLRQDKLVLKKTLAVTRKELEDTRATVSKFSKSRATSGGAKKDEVESLSYHIDKLNKQLTARLGEMQVLEDKVLEREKEVDILMGEVTRLTTAQVRLRNALDSAEEQLNVHNLINEYVSQRSQLLVLDPALANNDDTGKRASLLNSSGGESARSQGGYPIRV